MKPPVEKVVGDVKVLASDIKELVKATTAKSGEKLAQASARVQSAPGRTKEMVGVMRENPAARAADSYVHQNPWRAVGISAGVAFLVGLLIG